MSVNIRASDIELVLAQAALTRTGSTRDPSPNNAFGGEPNQTEFKSLTLDFLSALMKLPEIEHSARETDMRLRVALHLACPAAVEYDAGRSETRWSLIYAYIVENFSFDAEEAEKVSRLVAGVLDSWDTRRQRGLESRRGKLLQRQGYRCACCHLQLEDAARIAREEALALTNNSDSFKPYFDGNGVVAAMRPQVDHIAEVSKEGTNTPDNLQLLCALCNQGKSDNSGIRSSRELRYCGQPIASIPRGHRMSLLYYRLKMDRFACTDCGSTVNELTVRLIRERGLITLTNLRAICYQCLTKGDSAPAN